MDRRARSRPRQWPTASPNWGGSAASTAASTENCPVRHLADDGLTDHAEGQSLPRCRTMDYDPPTASVAGNSASSVQEGRAEEIGAGRQTLRRAYWQVFSDNWCPTRDNCRPDTNQVVTRQVSHDLSPRFGSELVDNRRAASVCLSTRFQGLTKLLVFSITYYWGTPPKSNGRMVKRHYGGKNCPTRGERVVTSWELKSCA